MMDSLELRAKRVARASGVVVRDEVTSAGVAGWRGFE